MEVGGVAGDWRVVEVAWLPGWGGVSVVWEEWTLEGWVRRGAGGTGDGDGDRPDAEDVDWAA